MTHRTGYLTILLVLGLSALAACTPAAPASIPTLKFAMLPVLDTLPVHIALQQGYFEASGIKVELVSVASAPERDQLIASGQVDGMMNELLTTMLADRDSVQIVTVRLARVATFEYPLFRIVGAPKGDITTPAQLKGQPVGISSGTVIEYVTERLLLAEGLTKGDLNFVSVSKMDDRLSLLANGQLKAATLPDPLSSLAIANGSAVIVDDTRHPEFSQSVLSFRKTVVDANPAAIRNFLNAVEQAVRDVNADGSKWDKLLADKNLLPAPLAGKYKLPKYPTSGVPSQAQFSDTLAWARAKGLLTQDLKYSDVVNASFLPQ